MNDRPTNDQTPNDQSGKDQPAWRRPLIELVTAVWTFGIALLYFRAVFEYGKLHASIPGWLTILCTGGTLVIGSVCVFMTRTFPWMALALTVAALVLLLRPTPSGLILALQPAIALAVGAASAWLMQHRRTR